MTVHDEKILSYFSMAEIYHMAGRYDRENYFAINRAIQFPAVRS